MKANLILAVLLIAFGIGASLWSTKKSPPQTGAPDPPASAPAGKFDPAIRRMGHVLVVSGVFLVAVAVRQRVRKARPPAPPS